DYDRWKALGNMLFDLKTAGFSSYLIRGLSATFSVYVTDLPLIPGPPAAFPVAYVETPDGYPPLAHYTFCGLRGGGEKVTIPGKHPVVYYRAVYKPGKTLVHECPTYIGQTSPRKIEYLSEMIPGKDQVSKKVTNRFREITFSDVNSYETAVIAVRQEVSQSWKAFLDTLLDEGVVSKVERDSVDKDPLIRITDDRTEKAVALPPVPGLRNVEMY
ncbi:MAG: hypothetical protein ACREDR_34900, partial [Blastocatellia bacterium]